MHKVFRYARTKKIWHINIILVNANNIDMSYLYYVYNIHYLSCSCGLYRFIVFRADTLEELDDKMVAIVHVDEKRIEEHQD